MLLRVSVAGYLLFMMLLVNAGHAGEPSAVEVFLQQGDKAFAERHDEAKARSALEAYRQARQSNPNGPKGIEAGWKLGMACYFVGLRLTQDKAQKTTLFEEGRRAALSALGRDAKCAPCHFWAGINTALFGESKGIAKTLYLLGSVRSHLRQSAELDPAFAFGGAYRVLGFIEQKLPGFLGGDNNRARDYFAKAVSAAPGEPMNYLAMARLLLNDFKNREEAGKFIAQGLSVPNLPQDRVESREALRELKLLGNQFEEMTAAR